nr:hypothetical protein [Tanacetum cinerariifolium]
MAGVDINTLTMEQYLALSQENQAPGVVKQEIRGNVNFDIKSQFMRELKEDTFSRNKNEDFHDHVDQVLTIVSLFNIPRVSQDTLLLHVFPFTLTGSAQRWVDRLTPGAVNYWDLLIKAFIQRTTNGTPSSSARECKVVNNNNHETKHNNHETQHRPISSRKLNDKNEWATKDIQCQLPPKELNPGNFTLPSTVSNFNFYGMADLGASVNVMPRNIFKYLRLANMRNTNILVEMADITKKAPLDWWHDHGFKKEECDEMEIEVEKYDPPEVQVETFEVRKYTFKGGQKFVCLTKEEDDTLPLRRRNGSRFKEMIRKEFDKNTYEKT